MVKLNVISVERCMAVFQRAHRVPDGECEARPTQCAL